MASPTTRLDALIRVSQRKERSGEEFRSPRQQLDICKRCADANDAEIVDTHDAIDVSGKTMNRSDVDKALQRIRAGLTDGIVVAWLDRFSRAPVGEALRVYDDIAAAGGRVIAADMAGLDPRDPTGELALTVMLAVHRMQWRKAAERFDMCIADAIKAGKSIGRPPFGYRYRDPGRRPDGRGVIDSRLEVHPTEGRIVRALFERKAAGDYTWLELARWLDNVAPKADGRSWQRTTVVSMLERRTYLGEVRSGKHSLPGAHEAIVTPAVWRRAQTKPGRRTPRGQYLLTSLARCASCSWRLHANSQGRKNTPRVYGCPNPDCPARPVVTEGRLDREVARQFFAHLDVFHVQAVTDDQVDAARADARARTETVERLAAVVPTHPKAIQAHQAALEAAEQDLGDAEDALHRLVLASSANGPTARQLEEDWPNLALDERREILRAGIDAVLVRRASSRTGRLPASDRILVLFRGQAPRELLGGRIDGVIRTWTWDDDPRSLTSTP